MFLGVRRFVDPHPVYLASFYDDFFYYLVPAQNLVASGFTSFDGTTPTNGYHPLWFCVITAAVWLLGGKPLGVEFFVFVSILIAALSLWTFHAARRLLVTLKVPSSPATLLAALLSIGAYRLGRGGMEVSLAIPLSLVLINRLVALPLPLQSAQQLLTTGFLVSLLVLARLDAALLPAIYASLFLCSAKPIRTSIKKLVTCALGAALIPAYLVSNKLFFGLWGTSSALAKQLKTDLLPRFDQTVLQELALHPQAWTEGPSIYWCFNLSMLLPTYVALLVLALRIVRHRLNFANHSHLACCAALLFPPVFFLIQRAASGWLLWHWYLYPFVLSTTCALAMAYPWFQRLRGSLVRSLFIVQACLLIIGGVAWHTVVATEPGMDEILDEALFITEFSRSHPGVYARGDRAGLLGYLLEYPLIQAEGLLMDRSYLESIRAQRDLTTVLRERGVDYYAPTRPRHPTHSNQCYSFAEPDAVQSGGHAHQLRGQICQEPVRSLHTGFGTTYIFSLKGAS
jgi:hypothetical protein